MDPEDYDDRGSVKNSAEIEAIPFEWTPELVRLSSSRWQIHPFFGPLEPSNEWPYYAFRPETPLPDPADTHECLKWFGLSDEKISEVQHKFDEVYPSLERPACGYEEKFSSRGFNSITFPQLDEMVNLYYRLLDHLTSDYEYTHGEAFPYHTLRQC